MSLLLSVASIVVIGFFIFHIAAKKSLNRQLGGAVSAVQVATGLRLMRRYEAGMGEEKAVGLASAVTNELFGNESPAEIAIAFRKNNSDLIARSLRELKNDHDLRVAVTDANRVLASLKGSRDTEIQRSFEHLQKLIELGILLTDRPAPQDLSLFLAMVRKYYEQNSSSQVG